MTEHLPPISHLRAAGPSFGVAAESLQGQNFIAVITSFVGEGFVCESIAPLDDGTRVFECCGPDAAGTLYEDVASLAGIEWVHGWTFVHTRPPASAEGAWILRLTGRRPDRRRCSKAGIVAPAGLSKADGKRWWKAYRALVATRTDVLTHEFVPVTLTH